MNKLQVVEMEKSNRGYIKLTLNNRDRFLMTESEYNKIFNEGLVDYESTSGNFYSASVENSVMYFEKTIEKLSLDAY